MALVVALAAVLGIQAAAAQQDSFCGTDMAYLVALQCGEGADAPVVITCVPEAAREGLCGLPAVDFAQSVCLDQVGTSATPTVVDGLTGAMILRYHAAASTWYTHEEILICIVCQTVCMREVNHSIEFKACLHERVGVVDLKLPTPLCNHTYRMQVAGSSVTTVMFQVQRLTNWHL